MHELATGALARHMTGSHVRNFMRHHSSQFRLIIGSENQSGIDVEKSAGKRECIDVVRVNHLNGEWNLGIRVAHQILADAVDVFANAGIGDQPGS